MHVKNPLSENMSTRLRMYKVLLFKFRRHLCKGSMKGYLLAHDETIMITVFKFESCLFAGKAGIQFFSSQAA